MLSDMQGLHGLGSLLQPRRGQDYNPDTSDSSDAQRVAVCFGYSLII
jgi:hypothetical protein